ncbi:MAG: serine/threonine protein kinase [Acidobacteria bacterium]|nr:serine/threonine protein kinase [Acidobacteriota bacterium]
MSLSPADFHQLEAWFAEASTLPAEKRARFVEICRETDARLASELEQMLEAQPLAEAAFLPRQHGDWRIKRVLGEGGLGLVRLAERDTPTGKQLGAIKHIHANFDAGSFRARFLKECEILKALAHPQIAAFLDAGLDSAGSPYFVMEYVNGLAWDDYTAHVKPTVERVAMLFRDLLAAVAYLHESSIVHADIKPSNVLIDRAGAVKLLDFGAARMLDADGKSRDSTFTRAMLTPEWASPEQRQGTSCTPASDIYSLGLLLRSCCGESADLRAIADKASRDEPSERYESALAMAADVTHFLRNEPVGARTANMQYRARKFARRHRIAAAFAACALVAAGAAWWIEAERARQASELRSTLIENVRPEKAIAQVLKSAAADMEADAPKTEQAQLHLRMAQMHAVRSRPDNAAQELKAAETAVAADAPSPERDKMRVRLLLSQGFVLGKQDKLVEAADMVIEAFKLWETIPDRNIELRQSGYYLRELADALIARGEFSRGIEILHWNVRRTEWIGDSATTNVNKRDLAARCAQIPEAIRSEEKLTKLCAN